MFADKVEIEVKAGKGGDGKLSFRHEKYRARGGPDGGDGGHGGDIIFIVDHNMNTLAKYKTQRSIRAEDGMIGGTNNSKGKSGQDVYIKVPLGTLVMNEEGELIADLTEDGQEVIIAKGGRGGFGNAHFTSSSRQAPRIAEVGEMGEVKLLTMEMKLVADVGLVGLPNAGKSTLLSVVSNAKPEIGDYPFTTIIPNLGVVDFEDLTFLVADIPGLIEGASEGKGLGDEFLRHVERTAVILHLIDAASTDVAADYKTIQKELATYSVDLTAKPQLLVITKSETVDDATIKAAEKALRKAAKQEVFVISAVAHKGIDTLFRAAAPLIIAARRHAEEIKAEPVIIDELSLPDVWRVTVEPDGTYRVEGERIEGFGRRTEWTNDDSVERIRDIMRKQGIAKELRRQGAIPGDTIRLGKNELEWL